MDLTLHLQKRRRRRKRAEFKTVSWKSKYSKIQPQQPRDISTKIKELRNKKQRLTRLIFVDLLQQRLGVVGAVELHDFGRITVVDLSDKFGQLATHSLVELLQELKAAALWRE